LIFQSKFSSCADAIPQDCRTSAIRCRHHHEVAEGERGFALGVSDNVGAKRGGRIRSRAVISLSALPAEAWSG